MFCSALISKEALTQLVGTRNFKAHSIFGNFLRTPKITTPNVPLPISLTKSKFEQILVLVLGSLETLKEYVYLHDIHKISHSSLILKEVYITIEPSLHMTRAQSIL